MDLREYDYIARRPDTYPKSSLMKIRSILSKAESDSINLIDKILKDGYIPPPDEYKWHGFYRIILTDIERKEVLEGLYAAEKGLEANSGTSSDDKHYFKQHLGGWKRCVDEVPSTFDEYKANQRYYNLVNISKNKFHEFLFEHPFDESSPWYCDFHMWFEYDEECISNLYIELFKDSQVLLSTYSKEKLEQGLWAIVSGNLECSAYNLLWDSELDISTKEKLICSMFDLFEKLFAVDSLDTSCNMWWDSLAFSFYEGGSSDPEKDVDVRRIQNTMFDTLQKILGLQSSACQLAALHGLGHLRHPDTESLIEGYISESNGLSDNQVLYARACIKGDIM